MIAVQPPDFYGLRLRPVVKPGDFVKVGSPLLEHKDDRRVKIVSPASGAVADIIRGEKRALLAVTVRCDGKQSALAFPKIPGAGIKNLAPDIIIGRMLAAGVWPCIRQRPFAKIGPPDTRPKSIFVQAHMTEPLSPDLDFILEGQEARFQQGLEILKKLTPGTVFVCCSSFPRSRAIREAQGVHVVGFAGPHPAGNVSTFIHYLDPVRKGDLVWYIGAEDVCRLADLFLEGRFNPQKTIAVTGEGAPARFYGQTVLGAPVRHLLTGTPPDSSRYISGSVLRGTDVGPAGYTCFYDQQVTVLPQGGKREFLGWIHPGWNKYSFSRTFLSSLPKRGKESPVSLDTDLHGGRRAIVLNQLYDGYVALDVLPYFLVRAIVSGDIEEAQRLGLLECAEEDFALCTFACPAKFDVGGVIREGLKLIEAEG
jgi:Na+-transporting NADH:ubiquinone oxidoreductase subunit A